MATYKIEQFMFKDWSEWPVEENETFTVLLRDGVRFETNTAKMELSSMFWDFYKEYKLLEARPEHFILKAPISNSDIQKIQSTFIRDIHETYKKRNYCKEESWKVLETTCENIYNTVILEYGEYLVSAGSIELAEIYFHPEIVKIRDEMIGTPESITNAQKTVMSIMKTCPTLARNPFIIDLRTGNVKAEQFLQVILVRGFNTELDGHIYKKAIMSNYFKGITDPAEVLMESTLAGKALLHQGAPLEQTEYANRMIQQSSAHVDLMIKGDCGSEVYAEIELTRGLFDVMTGLNYLDKGKLKPLEEDDDELIGRKLKFRVPFYCKHRDYQAVCETCYGELAHSVPYGSNLGTVAGTNSNSQVSQIVLKVKHSEDSANIEPIQIPARAAEFIHLSDDGEDIHVNRSLRERGVRLLISTVAKHKIIHGSKLPVLDPKEVSEGNIHNISEFDEVVFELPPDSDDKRPIRYRVGVSRGNRRSSLTVEFLKYMIKEEVKINDDGQYEVCLARWDVTKPVFRLPRLHMSMRDFANEVLTFIRSGVDGSSRHLSQLPQLKDYDDPTIALVDLTELINSKVRVHMTHIAVVMLSMMVARDGSYGYKTPPLGVPTRFATYNEIQTNRSLGVLFAYQGGSRQINSTMAQPLNRDRPQHLYDPLLMV